MLEIKVILIYFVRTMTENVFHFATCYLKRCRSIYTYGGRVGLKSLGGGTIGRLSYLNKWSGRVVVGGGVGRLLS